MARTEDGGGDITLSVDSQIVATGRIKRLLFMISSTGMDLGRSLSPVTDDYAAPFTYPGTLSKVVFQIPGEMPAGEVKARVRAEMTQQ